MKYNKSCKKDNAKPDAHMHFSDLEFWPIKYILTWLLFEIII